MISNYHLPLRTTSFPGNIIELPPWYNQEAHEFVILKLSFAWPQLVQPLNCCWAIVCLVVGSSGVRTTPQSPPSEVFLVHLYSAVPLWPSSTSRTFSCWKLKSYSISIPPSFQSLSSFVVPESTNSWYLNSVVPFSVPFCISSLWLVSFYLPWSLHTSPLPPCCNSSGVSFLWAWMIFSYASFSSLAHPLMHIFRLYILATVTDFLLQTCAFRLF